MPTERTLARSFASGEMSPETFGRVDLNKFLSGLATCRNFITQPYGSARNRTGFRFVKIAGGASANAVRMLPFNFNNVQAFAIEVGAGFTRFHALAGTLLVAPTAWSSSVSYNINDLVTNGGVTYAALAQNTNSAPPSVNWRTFAWSNSQAYNVGDIVTSGGTTYYCVVPHTNHAPPNATYWYAMPADGTYEIPNNFAAADLFNIHFVQSADVLTLVHPSYPPQELRRYGATNWQFTNCLFTPSIGPPGVAGGAGTPTQETYVVTATLRQAFNTNFPGINNATSPGQTVETVASATAVCNNDLSQAGAYNTITWSSFNQSGFSFQWIVTGYRIYKLVGSTYMYLGSSGGPFTTGNTFIDNSSIVPQNLQPPAISLYPPGGQVSGVLATATAAGGIGNITATPTPGGVVTTTYTYCVTAIDADSSESLASGSASCTNDLTIGTSPHYNTVTWPAVPGAIRYNVYKLSNGLFGYIGQAAGTSFVDNNIVADIAQTPPLLDDEMVGPGNYPQAVGYFEQRRAFAGWNNSPQSLEATRSGTESDLTYHIPSVADDRLALTIAAREASAIRHIVPVQDVILLTASNEFRMFSADGNAISALNVTVKPQAYVGASNVQPCVVNNTILYAAARGGHIREMAFNWQAQSYLTGDVSLLATHLFDFNSITDMAFANAPYPILWCVNNLGQLLGMSYIPDQQISAWHHHDTAGDLFESCCVITEQGQDFLYVSVNRQVNGAVQRSIERLDPRNFATQADDFFVDCGSTFVAVAGTYSASGSTTINCAVTNHGLTNGLSYPLAFSDLNLNGTYVVTVVDANHFNITYSNVLTESGTMTLPQTVITGLTWLVGRTVSVLGDGGVLPQQVVSGGGTITLPNPVSKAQIGLPITADLQTMPLVYYAQDYGQGKAKAINNAYLRVVSSSGVFAGPDFTNLVQYEQRTTEPYGTPPALITDEIGPIVLDAKWATSGQLCVRQSDPLPIIVASMTLDVSVGG